MTSLLPIYSRIKAESATIDDLLIKLDHKLEREAGDRVSETELSKIIVSKNKFFSKRLYELIPKQFDECPTRIDVVSYIANVVKGDADAKLRFYFQLVDQDNDERITEAEVKHILKHSVEENRFIFDDHEVDEMAKLVMQNADTDKDGYINFEEFRALFDCYQISNKIGDALESWLLAKPTNAALAANRRTKKISMTYIKNNVSSFIFIIGTILIATILSIQRIIEYEHSSLALIAARIGGQLLNLFSSLTLVLVLRRTLTLIRTYGICPGFLDKTLYYHKMIGCVIIVFSVIHTAGHMIESASSGKNYLFSSHFDSTGFRWAKGTAPLTGWLLWIPLTIIIFSSLPIVRQSGHFEIFHYCHLLYIVYWILLILHGPSFWMWILLPGTIFLVERWLLIRAKYGRRGKTWVEQAQILPQNVVQLVIKRPPNFYFNPGDWVYVQVPSIARWEWHPFTISSAPEIEDSIWLHIRPVGQWTKQVLSTIRKLENKAVVVFPARARGERRIRICDDINGCCVEKIGKSQFYLTNNNINHNNNNEIRVEMTASSLPNSLRESRFNDNSFAMSPLASSQFSTIRFQSTLDPSTGYSIDLPEYGISNNQFKRRQLGAKVSKVEKTKELAKRLSVALPSTNIKLRNSSTVIFLRSPQAVNEESSDKNNDYVINRSDYEKMRDMFRSSENASNNMKELNSKRIVKVDRSLSIRIDGPYGSPSSLIFNTEHAVLISTGIGVTPFASILRSIMMKYLDSRQQCPYCDNWFNRSSPSSVMKLQKVDFVWVNRDQYNLEWFIQLLSQLEIIQVELEQVKERRFLDMHIYITSAIKSGADIRAAFLRLALDNLNHGRDLITGLKTHTKPGRPDWHDFFQDIKKNQRGRVAVFYCGPPELGRELHHYANLHQFGFHKEVF